MINLRDERRRGQRNGAAKTAGMPDARAWADQPPLAYATALRAMTGCAVHTARLLRKRQLHLPAGRVGMRLRFADGTSSQVYRETAVDCAAAQEPCVLIVEFRLRAARGWGHALFRWESLLNTPMFAGFPGFVSKLWLANDERGRYRGVYQWDGPRQADHYARALWRVLALVSEPGSVHYVVLTGLGRDDFIRRPQALTGDAAAAPAAWWRVTGFS